MEKIKRSYLNWVNARPERKELYKSLVLLVIPIAIQNLLNSLVGAADVFMVTYVGQDELSALSLANQYMFLLSGFFFGINSATALMNSQYWGKGDKKAIQVVFGIAFKLSLLVTGIVSLACILIPGQLMALYTDKTELIPLGQKYLRIVGGSFIFMSFSQAYLCTLRSVEQAKKSTILSTVTVVVNVTLNATFIFGLGGAPRLGVVGVAIATAASRIIELALCLIDYFKGSIFEPDLKLLLKRNKLLNKDFRKYSGPALINDMSWTIAFSLYSVILGHLDADVVAAAAIAATIRDIFTAVCYGISSGGTVILGKELGSNRPDKAKKDAAVLCHITLIITGILGVILVLIRHPLMSIFSSKLTDIAYGYLDKMMIISGYYIVGQAINTLVIAGVFRAGGNTKFGMICDTITMWLVSLPLGFLSAFVFKLPPIVVYFILCLDEFWKMPAVYKYYKSYRWLNNITRDDVVKE